MHQCGDDGCGGSCGTGCAPGVACVDGACASCFDANQGKALCGVGNVGSSQNPDLGACSCADGCGQEGTPCCPDLCTYCPNTWVRFNPDYGLQDFNICQCQPHTECQQGDAYGLRCGATSDGCGGRCTCPPDRSCEYDQAAAAAHKDPWRCQCMPKGFNPDFWNQRDALRASWPAPSWYWHNFARRVCDWGCGDRRPCPRVDEPCVSVEREFRGQVLRGIGICAGLLNCEDPSLPGGRKECGSNGYGRVCGQYGGGCPYNHVCEGNGRCVCQPRCTGPSGGLFECGEDGCGRSCGSCPPQNECRHDRRSGARACVCVPDCAGKSCGDDGCGGSCGTCQPAYANTVCADGQCRCEPDCAGKGCGDDGCGGICGSCGEGQACSAAHVCEPYETGCQALLSPGCSDCACQAEVCAVEQDCCDQLWDESCAALCRTSTAGCGRSYCDNGVGLCDEGAGESCHACPEDCACETGKTCTFDGQCCTPSCAGKACGYDGCGGSCGSCSGGVCDNGLCVSPEVGSCVGSCPIYPWDAFKRDSSDVCGCGSACATTGDCCSDVCSCGALARIDLRLDEASLRDGAILSDSARSPQRVRLVAGDGAERSIAGRFDRAVHLEAGDALQLAVPLLSTDNASTELSLHFWMRTGTAGGDLLRQDAGAGSATRFHLRLLPDGRLSYEKGGLSLAATVSGLADGTWHQVLLLRDAAGDLTFYVDGSGNGGGSGDSVAFDDASLVIGQGYGGDLDDVAIYAGVLSSSQRAALFGQRARIYYGPNGFCDSECVPSCDYGFTGMDYATGPDGCGGWCPCPAGAYRQQSDATRWRCVVDSCASACGIDGLRRADGCGCGFPCMDPPEGSDRDCCSDLCNDCPDFDYCPFLASCDGAECGTVLHNPDPPEFCGDWGGCSEAWHRCMPDGSCCAQDCQDKDCGDDGCGGSCGECGDGQVCDAGGLCVCAPQCQGKDCGDDGCGGVCGPCDGPQDACLDGVCTCFPACDGKLCGDDGCQGQCGLCGPGSTCDAGGRCVCVPGCSDRACGDDGCGGSCGACSGAQDVCWDGHCICQPDCAGKVCGDDGCGGSCGSCDAGLFCVRGQCASPESCAGACGGQAGAGCMCDEACGERGDCCADRCRACPALLACSSCGNGRCDIDTGEGCDSCAQDCLCAADQPCYHGSCCSPDCAGRSCGDDGCGGQCGTCAGGSRCTGDGRCTSGPGCQASIDPGCRDCQCADCVCQYLPECCSGAWSERCADLCATWCGGCEVAGHCGDAVCQAELGETCSSCQSDCACPFGQSCQVGRGCCMPACAGKACGPDGCGGQCGTCASGLCLGGQCRSGDGCRARPTAGCDGCACQNCVCGLVPECCSESWGEACVSLCNLACSGCGTQASCGNGRCEPEHNEGCFGCPSDCACAAGSTCLPSGACCQPDCGGRSCGDDGCGGSCGACADGVCADGVCLAGPGCQLSSEPGCAGCACAPCVAALQPSCAEQPWDATCLRLCNGPCGGCGGLEACGDGTCQRAQGETCANCPGDCRCDDEQLCSPFDCCQRDCTGKACGDDGCDGSCGDCPQPDLCHLGGRCVDGVCQASSEVTCPDDPPCLVGRCSVAAGGCILGPGPDGETCLDVDGSAGRCRAGVCQRLLSGDRCQDPLRLTLDEPQRIDLASLWDDVRPGADCPDLVAAEDDASGADAFVLFTAHRGQTDIVQATAPSSDRTPLLWALAECGAACEAERATSDSRQGLTVQADRDGDLLVVVDLAASMPEGPVDVVVRLQPSTSEDSGEAQGCDCTEARGSTPLTATVPGLVLAGLLLGRLTRRRPGRHVPCADRPGCRARDRRGTKSGSSRDQAGTK